MRVADRACGVEYEFGIVFQTISGNFHTMPEEYISDNFLARSSPLPGAFMPSFQPFRVWHTNGSCTYIDRGGHPEHCTPECRTALDIVLFSSAGERICADYFKEVPADGSRTLLFKNNLGCDAYGNMAGVFGCHENYMLHNPLMFSSAQKEGTLALLPFLLTRQIFDGAGWWSADGKYVLSQRNVSNKDHANTPQMLVHTKQESGTGTSSRLHVTCGDSNMLEWATYLKIGSTLLVLALAEAKKTPHVSLVDLRLGLQHMDSATDVNAATKALEISGRTLSPLEVQMIYLEGVRRELRQAEFESEETEADSRRVLLVWEQTLNALYRGDEEWLRGRIDWVTKKYLTEQAVRKKTEISSDEMKSIRKDVDILYHDITDRTIPAYVNRRWADRRLWTDEKIDQAKIVPPQNTRALLRSKFIETMIRGDAHHRKSAWVDWACCGMHEMKFSLPDVLTYQSEEFEDFLRGISNVITA